MAEEFQTKTVPDDLAGQRFGRALAKMFPEYSRSRLKSWILQGFVTVDGGEKRPRDLVSGGETVSLRPAEELGVVSAPEPMELDIGFEDDELLIVNKPAGLVVHPGAGNLRGTLMNGLLHRIPSLAELPRAPGRQDPAVTYGARAYARSAGSIQNIRRRLQWCADRWGDH